MATEGLDLRLQEEIAAVEAIAWVRTPWEWIEDVILRRKPNHKEVAKQGVAHHGRTLALLLAEASRRGDLSEKLVGEIDYVLTIGNIRGWAKRQPWLKVFSTLPLPELLTRPAGLPINSELGWLHTCQLAGVARRVLREHGVDVSD